MTTKHDQLIGLAYPGGADAFDSYVRARIGQGASWRTIRDEVNTRLEGGVSVTHAYLHARYRDRKAGAA